MGGSEGATTNMAKATLADQEFEITHDDIVKNETMKAIVWEMVEFIKNYPRSEFDRWPSQSNWLQTNKSGKNDIKMERTAMDRLETYFVTAQHFRGLISDMIEYINAERKWEEETVSVDEWAKNSKFHADTGGGRVNGRPVRRLAPPGWGEGGGSVEGELFTIALAEARLPGWGYKTVRLICGIIVLMALLGWTMLPGGRVGKVITKLF